ncbi:MAG: prephenate dehydrogenase/arogenate dehydrogenase family protein [Polyangiaceae bacterium]
MKLCVAGFGLIGGSIAASVRSRDPRARVVAVDLPHVLASDSVVRLSDRRVDATCDAEVNAAFEDSDLVVLATPIARIGELLPRAVAHARLVTDCGSTKRWLVALVERSERRGQFVPGHPLAGGSEGGAERANGELFSGKRWILCPEQTHPEALAEVEAFVRGLGALPVHLSASEHDRALALTSHVPQIVASALAVLSARRAAQAGEGPGFASTTRVAGGNPGVWQDILSTNADEIADALREVARELESVAVGLDGERPDLTPALDLIAGARSLRRS